MDVCSAFSGHRYSPITTGFIITVATLAVAVLLAPAVVTASSGPNTTITDAAAADSGEQTVIVRFDDPQQLPVGAADTTPVGKMQLNATNSQRRFERFAAGNPYVDIEDSFWIANAMLVEVDTNQVSLTRLTGIKNVRLIHDNFKVGALDTAPESAGTHAGIRQVSTTSSDYTWGLEEIRAAKTWQQFDNRGDDVSVAVLDTGVDDSHPDINVAKWKDFEDSAFDDGDGDSPSPTPKDYGTHGTHVSGTVVGGDTSGTHIGVAPNASLYAGAVLTQPGGAGYVSNILNGMEWAVEQDADIVSMSLGGTGTDSVYIEPIRNARQAGTIPVIAVGNDEEGSSSSPGNVYDAIAIGASARDDSIASFSGGETIAKTEWNNPPADWPSSYVVPDLSAPGTFVYSSEPGENYGFESGTSMATPHVSGGIALILSNGHGDLSSTGVQSLLEETAVDLDEAENRQGAGEVDIYAATVRHSWNTLQPTLSPTTANVSVPIQLTVPVNHPIATYYWTLPNGSTVTTSDETLTHSFEQRDEAATVEIVFEDIRGKNKTTTKTVAVGDAIPPAPSVTANQSTAEVGIEAVRFNASQSTDNDAIDHYDWQFGDDTTTRSSDPVVAHTFESRGNQSVRLTATDRVGNTNTTNITVDVVDTTKPTPRISAPMSATLGVPVTLNASRSTDNGAVANYIWQFDDDTNATGETVTHTFTTRRSRTVTLNTTDGAGNTNTTQATVEASGIPSVTVSSPASGSYVDTETVPVQYTLANTTATNASALQYRVTSPGGSRAVSDWQAANFTETAAPASNTTRVGPLDDGNYSIELRLVDDTGSPLSHAAAAANRSIAVKTTLPTTSLAVNVANAAFDAIGPHNPATIPASVNDSLTPTTTLMITNTTGATVRQWDLSAETGAGQQTNRTWNGTAADGSLVDNGQYTINLTAADGIGNTNTKTRSVMVDTATPNVTIDSINGGHVVDGTRYFNTSTTLDVTISADDDGDGVDPVRIPTLAAVATEMKYKYTPAVSQLSADSIPWTATLGGATLAEPGRYDLSADATDDANNTGVSDTYELVYDRRPPDISAVITNTDPNTETATVAVRASEPLPSSPSVTVKYPNGTTSSVGVTPSGDQWRGTVDINDTGQYTITATGTDRAGNSGRGRATTRVRNDVSTENGTALVHDDQSGVFIRVNTTTPVSDRTVALTGTSVAPAALTTGEVGVQFLEGALDTDLSNNLQNATVGIPVNQSAVPAGVPVDDSRIKIEHYNETASQWTPKQTRITTVDESIDALEGRYWVSTVDSFSAYGVTATDTTAPELTDTTATKSDDGRTVTINATYSDALSGINASATELTIDETVKTDATNTTITSSRVTYTGYPVGDEEYSIDLTVEDDAGNRRTYQRTLTVDTADDTPSDDDSVGGGGGGGGGGGESGGGAPTQQGPPSIAEVRGTLNLISPTTTTTTQLQDADSETSGMTVTPAETLLVNTITFDNTELTGSVSISEYLDPPRQIRDRIAQSIAGAGILAPGDGTDGADRMTVVSVADVSPTTDQTEDTAATVRLSVPKTRVQNPQQLTVFKETYDFEAQATTWTQVETDIAETDGDSITVSARVEEFSLFAVVEQEGQTQTQTSTDDQPEKTTDTDDGEAPIAPLVVGLLAVVAVGGTVYYLRGNEG